MADTVKAPLLAIASAESASAVASKRTQSASIGGKNGDNEQFSRVLDSQRSRADNGRADKAASNSSESRESRESRESGDNGNRLPEERTASATDTPESSTAARSDSDASQAASVSEPVATDEAATSASTESDSDKPALPATGEAAAASTVGSSRDGEDRSGALTTAAGDAADSESSRIVARGTSTGADALAPARQTQAPADAGGSLGASDAARNPAVTGGSNAATMAPVAGSTPIVISGVAAADAAGVSLQAGAAAANPDAKSLTAQVLGGPAAPDFGAASSAPDKWRALPGGATADAAQSAATQSELLTRSRVDWLRGSAANEAAGVISPMDSLKDSPELRGGAQLVRVEPSLAAPQAASSNIAAMMPAAAGASSSPASPSNGLLADYSLAHAPADPEFPGELTARMKTLLRDGVREARLQLHPAELGRLHVTVTTDGDQARVSFVADTSAARDAIEQSLPRLREMLEQNGLQLAQSDVGQRNLQDGSEQNGGSGSTAQGDGAAVVEDDAVEILAARSTNSRIDTYI